MIGAVNGWAGEQPVYLDFFLNRNRIVIFDGRRRAGDPSRNPEVSCNGAFYAPLPYRPGVEDGLMNASGYGSKTEWDLKMSTHDRFWTRFLRWMGQPVPRRIRPVHLFFPVLSAALAYGLAYLVSHHHFSVTILPIGMGRDIPLVLALSCLLFFLSRRIWTFVALQWLLIAILYVGNAAKLSFFGNPIVPDDLFALRSLLLVLDGRQFVLVAGSLAVLAGLLFLNFHFRQRRAWLTLGVILALSLALARYPRPVVAALDTWVGNCVWDQRSNYIHKGAALYSLQETSRFFQDAGRTPDKVEAALAASTLLAQFPIERQSVSKEPRNVYLILLESFWDPLLLKNVRFNRDPLGPSFRKMWKATGHSTIMSPVFGGYTANAEFESLCGFPVVDDDIKFERRMRNAAPCLPAVLGAHGYDTVVSHPNIPSFWNRVNAYNRLGFQTYWSIRDFELDDMNFEFLSDISLYRQVLDKQRQRQVPEKAAFHYIVTYFGHWAGSELYPRNESRPQVIRCVERCETPEIESYANAAYYKAQEFVAFVERLRKEDPDALIVAFGDHLPYLGENFQGYVEAGTLAGARAEFTPEMFLTYVSTPLVVIDGRRGPVKMGALPLYQLPGRILEILAIDEPTILGYAQTASVSGVRPLWGVHFVKADSGGIELCRDGEMSATCDSSAAWLDQLLTVGVDVFQGKQYALPLLDSSRVATIHDPDDRDEKQVIQ